MTSLETGVQYRLSSQGHFNENKALIFVKLTDSAARTIEEHLRNKNKLNQKPTIQFHGNEGRLFFPSSKSEHQGNFTFSLSNDQDIEGTQGGFECIQKTGPKEMESLGAFFCKMRIHANDDIFETTRHRMQAVEVSNKNKCTRVLKSNETVGKKVKVKGTVRKIIPSSASNLSTSPMHRVLSNSSSSAAASAAVATVPQQAKYPASKPPSVNSNARSQADAPSRKQHNNPEIMRRSLKERLIHLLALRPYKRPELFDRIYQDGVKEQEKNVISNVLKQISHMQSNAYHLHASAWNDVQDDWPFYTDDERAMLKRRKPQNLTPPGSSDGSSSGSGQSPNSMRSYSPPGIISSSVGAINAKRSVYEQPTNVFPQKRQRISDYRKPEVNFITNFQDNSQDNSADLMNCLNDKQRMQEDSQPHNKDSFDTFSEHNDKPDDSDSNCNSTFPDYLQAYTTIVTPEQRKQYKADFRAFYEDYTKQHFHMCEISKHFIVLEEELKRRANAGDVAGFEETKLEIVDEYKKTKAVKLRFQYLHDKLSHIKKLVSDYDDKMFNDCESNSAY